MKKDLLIAGSMRSGKTLLANQMMGRFIPVQTDHIILALQSAHPDLGVARSGASYDELCEAFRPFLIEYALLLSQDLDKRYVLDCYYIRPCDIALLPTSFRAIFLGYPEMTIVQKTTQLRGWSQQNNCYTEEIPEARLRAFVSNWIDQSRHFLAECDQLEIPFFDTSKNFCEAMSYLQKIP